MTLHSCDVGGEGLNVRVIADHDRARQTAVDNHMGAVGGFVDFQHFGAEHDHGVASARIVAQQSINFALAVNIHATRRLLEQEQAAARN